MTSLLPVEYTPRTAEQATYEELYRLYRDLHDSFGGLSRSADLSGVMKSLLEIKSAASGE